MAKEVKQRSLDSFFQLKRSGDSNAIVLDDESDTTHSEDTVTKKKKRKFQPSWKTLQMARVRSRELQDVLLSL